MNGPAEPEVYSYVQKRSGNKFADGFNTLGGDIFDEDITMNGPATPESYSYAQKQHRANFATGYGDHEQFGDTIKTNGMSKQDSSSFVQMKSGNRFADGFNTLGGDIFDEDITMNGPATPESYSYAQ